MQTESRWLGVLGLSAIIILGLGFSSPLLADPPARVARLNYVQGAVSFHPATVDDWAPAQLNYPLTTGDGIWTDNNSRAELHSGSTAIEFSPQTNSRILNLDDQTVQIELTQGTLEMRIRSIRPDEIYEVDTPNVAISPTRPGWYRIDVDPQGNTTATSRDGGEAELTAAGSAFSVYDNQTARIYGTDSPTYDVQNAPPLDGFDQWCLSRYRREERPASLRYVSRDLIGYEDLDPYGYWRDVPGYGPCWIPSHLAADWAPYRYGHWCWEEPWGWTWIDDQPWGFATCHYGRWIHRGGLGWAWSPGPLFARPYYAPALVAFVGGNNWGVSFASGASPIGWFPLGPGEIYVPPYQVSNVYIRNVNYEIRNFRPGNLSGLNVRYMNREFPGAITVVPRDAFVSAAPAYRSIVHLPQRELASARVLGATAPLVPRRESVLAHPSRFLDFGSRATPPASVRNRPVVVRRQPPPPRVPFSAQERLLAQHPGRPPVSAALSGLRTQARVPEPQVRMAVPHGPAPGMRPARPGIPPAQPAAGAQVRNTPQVQPRPPMPPQARTMPSPQHGQAGIAGPPNRGARAGAAPEQNAPGAPPMRPPQRMGRTTPFPAAPPPSQGAVPQARPRENAPQMQRQRPAQSTPRPQMRVPQNSEQPARQAAPPPHQSRQSPPQMQPQRPAQIQPRPQRQAPQNSEQPARQQAMRPPHQPNQSPPQMQPRAQPNSRPQPAPQRAAPQMQPRPQGGNPHGGGPPPQQQQNGGGGDGNPHKDQGRH